MDKYQVYQSNSHKSKSDGATEPEHKATRVVDSATRKKKNLFQKLANVILADDIQDVKGYIVSDIVIPGIKQAISNSVNSFLYGRDFRAKNNSASKVSYRSYYETPEPRATAGWGGRAYDYDDVVVNTMGDAQRVLSEMEKILGTYRVVTVLDLYEASGVSTRWSDRDYGWTDLRQARIIRVNGGYLIKMPRPMPID